MFFYLSKILAFVITPLVWVLALLFVSLFSKNTTRKKKSLKASLIILLILSNPFLYDEFMRTWEVPAIEQNSLTKNYDAVIVLGGMIKYDDQLKRIQFDRGSDRLLQAIELYKKGYAKKILFCGGSGSILHPEAKEANYARSYMLTLGIPEEDIIIETNSRNTHENALEAKKIIDKEFPNGKFIAITSAFHMRRAMGCLNNEGIAATPYSTDRMSGPRKYEFDHLFIPNIEAITGWNKVIHEITGYLVYKLMGYC